MTAIEWPEFRFQRRARYYKLIAAAVPQMRDEEPIHHIDPTSYSYFLAIQAAAMTFKEMHKWLGGVDAPAKHEKTDPDLMVVQSLFWCYSKRAVELYETGAIAPKRPPEEKLLLDIAKRLLVADPDLVRQIGANAGVPVTPIRLDATGPASPDDDYEFADEIAFNSLWRDWVHPRVKSPFAR